MEYLTKDAYTHLNADDISGWSIIEDFTSTEGRVATWVRINERLKRRY